MWSNGAVVVIKRGDPRIADSIESGALAVRRDKTNEDYKNLKRDYSIMSAGRKAKLKQAMKDSEKYTYKCKKTPKPLLYLQIGYAMLACAINGVRDAFWSRKKQSL